MSVKKNKTIKDIIKKKCRMPMSFSQNMLLNFEIDNYKYAQLSPHKVSTSGPSRKKKT